MDERSRSNSATLGLTFVSPRVRRFIACVENPEILGLCMRLYGISVADSEALCWHFSGGGGAMGDGVDRCGDVMSGQVVPQRPEQPREPQEEENEVCEEETITPKIGW